MGSVTHLGGATGALVWAQKCLREVPPTASIGPSIVPVMCRQYARLGPAMDLGAAIDSLEWAQKRPWKVLSTHSNGLSISFEKCYRGHF